MKPPDPGRAKQRDPVRKHLDELTVTVGIPGRFGQCKEHADRTRRNRRGEGALEKLIRTTAADRERVKALVLFIDEVQSADAEGIRTLAYAWQHLQAEASDIPAAVYAAGLPNAPEQIADAVTFSERFAYRPIEMLTVGAQVAALRDPAAELGVTWEPEALELAAELAAGYPYAVQLYGDAAWVAAGRPDAGRWDRPAQCGVRAHQCRPRPSQPLRRTMGQHDAESAALSRRGRVVAGREHQRGPGRTRRCAGSEFAQPSSVRARLIAKGLIHSESHGRVTIPVPGFAGYIRELESDPR